MCYYEGAQWVGLGQHLPNTSAPPLVRLAANFDPDTRRMLRATINRTTRHITMVAAATYPERIEVEGLPPIAGGDASASLRAQAFEDAVNVMARHAGVVTAARNANVRRSIAGSYGIGLMLSKSVNGKETVLRAFDFPAHRLILDPSHTSPFLHEHDCVIYHDVWTAAKWRRTFDTTALPEKMLEGAQLRKVRDLCATEIELYGLSGNRLFSHYKTHSETPAAEVFMVFVRGSGHRFDKLYMVFGGPDGKRVVLNPDNAENPYGWNGMPLFLLHATPRADTMWGISDVSMLRDDQDRLNLIGTLYMRHMQKTAGFQWIVDRRSMPSNVTSEQLKSQFTNMVGGVIEMDSTRAGSRPAYPPQLVQHPPPQPALLDAMSWTTNEMRQQIARSEAHTGAVKTHVTAEAFRLGLDAADLPLGVRVSGDIEVYRQIMLTVAGTTVNLLKTQESSTAHLLADAGLKEEEIASIAESDAARPPVELRIRESSVRYRPVDARKNDLERALQMGAITPETYREALASELDTPLTEKDRFWSRHAARVADGVLRGEPFSPIPAGEYQSFVMTALRRAMFDERAKDPMVQQAVMQAIVTQQQAAMYERVLSGEILTGDPNSASNPSRTTMEPGPEQPGEVLGDVLTRLNTGAAA